MICVHTKMRGITTSKYAVHRFYLGNSLKASSNVIPGAISGQSIGSVCRYHGYSMPQIFSSSCGLIRHSGVSLILLYVSGDFELNRGPVERSQHKQTRGIH